MTTDTRTCRDDGSRDLEQAVADLAERLPEVLQPLARVAFNYRWSWTPGGDPFAVRAMNSRCLRTGAVRLPATTGVVGARVGAALSVG